MTNITQFKRDKVDSFSKELQAASIIFFTDYRGLKVSDITSLRKSLRKENARGIVIKNTMSKLAFQKLGLRL